MELFILAKRILVVVEWLKRQQLELPNNWYHLALKATA